MAPNDTAPEDADSSLRKQSTARKKYGKKVDEPPLTGGKRARAASSSSSKLVKHEIHNKRHGSSGSIDPTLDTIDPALRDDHNNNVDQTWTTTHSNTGSADPPRSWSDVEALRDGPPAQDTANVDMDGRYPPHYAYTGGNNGHAYGGAYGYVPPPQQTGLKSPQESYLQGNAIAGSSRQPAQYSQLQSQPPTSQQAFNPYEQQQSLERSPVAGTSSAAAPSSARAKLYACEFPGCEKSFNRRDYLDRHALNHSSQPAHVCELCGKGFARVDVFKKHQLRYCPNREGAAEDAQTSRQRRATSGQSGSDDNHRDSNGSRKRQRITPSESRSMSNSRMPAPSDPSHHARGPPNQYLPQDSHGGIRSPPNQMMSSRSEFQGHPGGGGLMSGITPSSATSSSSASAYGGFNHQRHQQQGGGCSLSGYPGAYGLHSGEPSPPIMMHNAQQHALPGSPARPTTGNVDDLLSWLFQASPEAWTGSIPPSRAGGPLHDQTPQHHPHHPASTSINAELMAPMVPVGMRHGLPSAISSPVALHDSGAAANRPRHIHQQQQEGPSMEFARSENALPGGGNAQAFAPSSAFDPAKELITSEVRDDMLNLFEQPLKAALDHALSVNTMRSHIDLYFMWSNPLYPILHRPSLAHRSPPPDLLMIMVCFGIAFTHDEALLELAMKAHKRLRHRIFELVEETPLIPTPVLQTLLLVNYFGRMYCSALEHDISQIFHAPSMSLARASGILLRRAAQPPTAPKDLVSTWLEWVSQEEENRLAWFAFLSDTSNAALFRHYLLIHCFSMQCELPCANALWDAPDPQTWVSNQTLHPIPGTLSLRNALRDLLGKEVITTTEDFGSWILLHGLLSVSWALLFRDLGALSMIGEEKIYSWKHSLSRGFQIWKAHVGKLHRDRIEGGANDFDMMIFTAGIPLCHLGIILGMSDTEEIRIFSGASTVAARPISPGEWRSAATYCNAWARSEDGAHACWAALQLLNHVIHGTGVEEAPLITHWCMYLATLAIWTYVSILDGHHHLLEDFVILPDLVGGDVIVDSIRARKSAMSYLKRMLSVKSANELAYVADKNRCGAIIAYVVHLASQFNRGILTEPRRVLTGLLVEHAPLQSAAGGMRVAR